MYKLNRNYLNLNKAFFDGFGFYDFPEIRPVHDCFVDEIIPFNFAKGRYDPAHCGIHFFIDDYQFERVWNRPDSYLSMLSRFGLVFTPDFSVYSDFPKAIQIYNHYRKHWLGAYWQQNGIYVIPTISWSDQNSFEWCFDGEPVGSIVAVSSVGTQKNPRAKELFDLGFQEMLTRLEPEKIIIYGLYVPDSCSCDYVLVNSFQNKFRKES